MIAKILSLLIIFSFLIGCGQGNRLRGTFVIDSNQNRNIENAQIEFVGRNFVFTDFPKSRWQSTWFGLNEVWHNYVSFMEGGDLTNLRTLQEVSAGTLFYFNEVVTDKNNTDYERVLRGSYTINNNQIEMVFDSGTVRVFQFSSTENTITIDVVRFVRNR